MTRLAYMVREDWAQHGTAMQRQSGVIRDWLGDTPLLFATGDLKKFNDRGADREFVRYLVGDSSPSQVVSTASLHPLCQAGDPVDLSIVAVHPFGERDCETLRKMIRAGRLSRVFVIVWAPTETVRAMLEGLGAVDLGTDATPPVLDAVQLKAARDMADEQYNGLSSGHGKDVVVQLIRAFTNQGYPLDVNNWLSAFFAAGGEFDEAEKVKKLIKEMQKGVRHRVNDPFRPNIVDILRGQVESDAAH